MQSYGDRSCTAGTGMANTHAGSHCVTSTIMQYDQRIKLCFNQFFIITDITGITMYKQLTCFFISNNSTNANTYKSSFLDRAGRFEHYLYVSCSSFVETCIHKAYLIYLRRYFKHQREQLLYKSSIVIIPTICLLKYKLLLRYNNLFTELYVYV